MSLGAERTGCRGYLAIAGGFDVAPVLGSRATYLRAVIGGHEGRALREGDVLRVRARDGLKRIPGEQPLVPIGHGFAGRIAAGANFRTLVGSRSQGASLAGEGVGRERLAPTASCEPTLWGF